ncbi:MuF-like minor capsid protein [Arthrobacter phage Chipper1996]|uniref:MuF-like minor capsid protein n=4 Tax=Klausavirus princesstrina TaxID=1984784 RepID=A0A286N418_9CAUD|nr:MuF-like minor capsid protein [Arthrobacter phage Conboy]APC44689.1 MuF-like minor capsid protein [Arthrobacter phage EdgarPoe]ASX99125.1 MuF-like minor capsid protein [Arthrobacter phage Tophat]QBP30376.1 MuF-like minor capsid protein [Arthrobacter phage Chipper1996]
MCHECVAVEAQIESLVLLAEVEREVIAAEIAAGQNVTNATRALLPHEAEAKVRFGDIEALTAAAVEEATQVLQGLRDVITGAVLSAMVGDAETVTPTEATRALAQLNAAQPRPVQDAVAKTAMALQGIFGRVALGASSIVMGEAKRQGINVDGFQPNAVPDEVFKLPAAAAALHPWQRITGKLQTVLTQPANLFRDAIPREEITKEVDKIPLDGSVDMAKQAVHSAHGLGRNEAAADLNPSAIYASEIMDGNTCRACADIDSHKYPDLETAMADYPNGGYDGCEGGLRCRGTLVFMYDDPVIPRDDPNPEPLPPIPPEPTPAPEPDKPKTPRKRKPKVTPAPVEDPKPQTRKEALAKERAEQEPETPGLPKPPTGTPPPRKKGQSQRYTDIDQLPIDHGKVTDTPGLVAKYTNPGHDKVYGTKFYNNNCSSVVQAYEFQRRGYDVKAAPVADGKGRYDAEYVSQWWKDAKGNPALMEYVSLLPDVPGRMNKHLRAVAKLEQWADPFPDGARGFVALHWTQGGGHVFNWEKVDGKLTWLEGQTGDWDAARHFTPGMFKPDSVRIVRIDDKIPTPLAMQALETRPRGLEQEVAETGINGSGGLSSADKKARSVWRMRTGPNGIEYLPPSYRKNKSNRWEAIPEFERAKMLVDFQKNGNRPT